MTEYFDSAETREVGAREAALMGLLPGLVGAALRAPGWRRHLGEVSAEGVKSRADLARLAVLRKSDLPRLQMEDPPFGGFRTGVPSGGRVFVSPGPIYECEGAGSDPWRAGRAFFAAGFRAGEVVLNTLGYALTPGGLILDSGARAVGCAVIPAGPGNTAQQVEIVRQLRPVGYCGTPDFLKILLDAVGEGCSIKKALVSGAAFPPSLQAELAGRGVEAFQAYATADLGVVAFETAGREGLVVNEDVLVEIVRPGTGDSVPDGEVGEVVVTSFDMEQPLIRLALGDLSAVLPGVSPCGRTGMRIRGWMGRADQATKIKGMFVRPEQMAAVARMVPGAGRLRLVVLRDGERDRAVIRMQGGVGLTEAVGAAFQGVTQLRADVEVVEALPNDGKVIADER